MMWSKIVVLTTILIINGALCYTVPPAERSYSSNVIEGKRGIYGPAGLSKFGAEDGSTSYSEKTSSLTNPMNPYLSLRPFLPAKPTFFPPVVNPKVFVDKKAQMLNSLFSSPEFTNFPVKNGISKPEQIVTNYPPLPLNPGINPNVFIDKKTQLMNQLFGQFSANEEPIPTAQRDLLGEYSGGSLIQTRLVPAQGPSSGPFLSPIDKIKFFSDKKTQFLDKLFKTINVTAQPITDSSSTGDGLSATVKPTIVPPSFWIPNYLELAATGEEPSNNMVERQIAPQGTPLWTPLLPPIAKTYSDKKTDFLNKLFSSIVPSKTSPQTGSYLIQPEGPYSSSIDSGIGTTAKPTIVPPNFWIPEYKKPVITGEQPVANPIQRRLTPQAATMWNPFLPPPAKSYSDKKTDFLNKLFANIMSSPETSSQAGSALNSENPIIKPTIVPPSFWIPSYKQVVTPSSSFENDVAAQYSTNPAINGSDAILAVSFATLVNGVPVVDPTYFISKKNDFLSSLFHSLNLTKPSSTDTSAEDMAAHMYFVSQLFKYMNTTGVDSKSNQSNSTSKRNSHDSENIRINDLEKFLQIINDDYSSTDSENSNLLGERSVPVAGSASAYLSAKDSFVNNILTELMNIKNSMLQATSELIQQQKTTSTSSTPSASGKKTGSSYPSPYKMWGKAPIVAPTADPLQPFATKMIYLGQLFDTLTKLEKNMSLAMDLDSAAMPESQKNVANDVTLNSRALASEASSGNVAASQLCANYGELPLSELTSLANGPATADTLTTDALLNRSKKIFCHLLTKSKFSEESGVSSVGPVPRSIKMAVHQGYQSLPPGTEELLQAGGGGEAGQQEGGGIKLQNTGPNNGQEEMSSHHHHNHHQ